MSNQVVKCWNCQREFEVTLDGKPPVPVYKGLNPQNQTVPGRKQGKEIVRTCPFCKEQNIIVVPEEG
jgi:hypothetical protein